MSLKIRSYGEPVLRKRTFHCINGLRRSDVGVYNSNLTAVVSALSERYFNCEVEGAFLPPLPVLPGAYDECGYFRNHLVKKLRGFGLSARTRPDVVAAYHGRKRLVYEAAARNLDTHGLNDTAHVLATFVKFEKVDLSKAPRVIQPRTPEYTLELARYLKHLEKPAYKAIASLFGGPTVIKGCNSATSATHLKGMWDSFSDPVAVGLDATKFDMHVSSTALRFEHSVYNGVYRRSKLARLLSQQEINYGRAYAQDGNVRFTIEGTRSSGDINTALGNCIIMCALIHTRAKSAGVKLRLANNGDDCVVFMEREDLNKFTGGLVEWFEGKGFRMKVETPVDTFERLEFCQSHPVECDDGWRMVRNVETCLHKDAICLMPVGSEKDIKYWMGAVGECGRASSTGVPILEAYYRMFERAGLKPSTAYMTRYKYGTSADDRMLYGRAKITPNARASFHKAFGILPEVQSLLESSLDASTIDTHLYNQLRYQHTDPIEVPTNFCQYDQIEATATAQAQDQGACPGPDVAKSESLRYRRFPHGGVPSMPV